MHMITRPHTDGISTLTVSKNNRYLVSGGRDGSIKVYELATGQEITSFIQIHSAPILSVALFENNYLIASGSADGQLKLLNIINKSSKTCVKKAGAISSLAVTSDDKYLIAGSLEKTILIYDIHKDKILHEIRDPHYGSSVLSIVTNDEWVISGSTDGSIKIFDILTKQEIYSFENIHDGIKYLLNNIEDWVKTLCLTPDKRYIISGSADKSIKVIDIKTLQTVFQYCNIHRSKKLINLSLK